MSVFSPAAPMMGAMSPLLQTQTASLAALKLDIRAAMDRGNHEYARDLLQRAENQLGGETRDTALEKLTDELHVRETAPNAGDKAATLTNDGHKMGEVTMDAGGAANHGASFASEIELGSYKAKAIDVTNGGNMSQNAFPSAGSRPHADDDSNWMERKPDSHNIKEATDGIVKGGGASKAGQALDDVIGATAPTVEMGIMLPGLG